MPCERASATKSAFRSAHLPPIALFSTMNFTSPIAAAARLGIAEGVVDDPFVDRARLLEVALLALHDLVGGLLHDAVGRDELGRLRVLREDGLVLGLRVARSAQVDRDVARGEARGLREHGTHAFRPFGPNHAGAVLGVGHDSGRSARGLESRSQVFLVRRVLREGHGQPDASDAYGLEDLDPVVTSKVRHLSAGGAAAGYCASAESTADGRTAPAEASPLKRKKLRRSMLSSLGSGKGRMGYVDNNKAREAPGNGTPR